MDSLKLFKNKKSGYWYVRYSRGHEKSLKTKDRAVAEKAFKKATRKMVEDRLVRIDRENKTTLSEFTKEYLRISGGTKADPSKRSDKLSLETLAKFIEGGGGRYLHTLTSKLAAQFISDLAKAGLSNETINTYLRRIKAAMNAAVDWKYIDVSPFQKVKQLKVEKKLPRFLYGKEIKKLFKAITDEDFKKMVYFYVHTGCRRAELVRLKWGDIVKIKGAYVITIQKTKTSNQRIIDANAEAAKLIDSMKRGQKDAYVFPRWRTPDAVTRLFRKYADASKVPHIRLHDLRHTTASHLVMAGVDLKAVAEILGHTRTSTTDIYAHLVPDHLKKAMSKLEGSFNMEEIENDKVVSIKKGKK